MHKKLEMSDIFASFSEVQLPDVKKMFQGYCIVAQDSRSIKIRSQLTPYPIESLLIPFKNAYVDEGFRVFNSKKHIIPNALPCSTHVHWYGLPDIQDPLFKAKEWVYSKIYNDMQYIELKLYKSSIKKHFKDFEHKTFYDKNTVHKKVDKIALNFLSIHWTHFFEQIMNGLLDFYYLWNNLSPKIKKNIVILLPQVNPSNRLQVSNITTMKEILLRYGVQEEQFFIVKLGHLYQFDALYTTNYSMGFALNNLGILKNNIQYYRKEFFNESIKNNYKDYKRVFVDRRYGNIMSRFINNKDAFDKILKKYHIKRIFMEDVNFEEKINLLSNVELFVSTMSSAGMNSIFVNDGAKILILCTPDGNFVDKNDQSLSPNLPFIFSKIIYCIQEHPIDKNINFNIDLEKFEKTLCKLLHIIQ